MAIRVAGSTFAFGKMGLDESCKIMQEMGFDVVDVGGCGTSTFTDYVPQWFFENLDDTQGEADNIYYDSLNGRWQQRTSNWNPFATPKVVKPVVTWSADERSVRWEPLKD